MLAFPNFKILSNEVCGVQAWSGECNGMLTHKLSWAERRQVFRVCETVPLAKKLIEQRWTTFPWQLKHDAIERSKLHANFLTFQSSSCQSFQLATKTAECARNFRWLKSMSWWVAKHCRWTTLTDCRLAKHASVIINFETFELLQSGRTEEKASERKRNKRFMWFIVTAN